MKSILVLCYKSVWWHISILSKNRVQIRRCTPLAAHERCAFVRKQAPWWWWRGQATNQSNYQIGLRQARTMLNRRNTYAHVHISVGFWQSATVMNGRHKMIIRWDLFLPIVIVTIKFSCPLRAQFLLRNDWEM